MKIAFYTFVNMFGTVQLNLVSSHGHFLGHNMLAATGCCLILDRLQIKFVLLLGKPFSQLL